MSKAATGQFCLGLRRSGVVAVVLLAFAAPAAAQFVTFETGQVRPLALSSDGLQLFAVNTPDNQLEIFDVNGGNLAHVGAVPVGLEPCAVAVRPGTDEVWVVNHMSDSVSIVDMGATPPRVVRTLLTCDEPRDIVFAGTGGSRAFITTARRGQNCPVAANLTTEGTGRAIVQVFDATNLGASLGGTPIANVVLFGDTPRALAVNADGTTVYAAVFHSGNQTTAVTEGAVCDGGSGAAACSLDGITMPNGLPGGQVPGGLPAPNQNLTPPIATGPEVGLIVKFNNSNNRWEDRATPTVRNWTNAVRFSLPDTDVFSINANGSPAETAAFAHVGTVLFNMVTNPADSGPDPVRVYVSNTEARNEIRFEGPGGGGTTVRGHLHEARITVLNGSSVLPRHLNKHLDYDPPGGVQPPGAKDNSLATPLGMAITGDGSTLYVAAFGSSKVGVFSTSELDLDTFTPDENDHIAITDQDASSQICGTSCGPSGLVLDETNDRLYVFTRFDNGISVVDTSTNTEVAHLRVHNPEPASVVNGRHFLYDARFTSSNGEASCSSCHIFGDFDSLAWDLGNPDEAVVSNPNPEPTPGLPLLGQPFHPMKGPMTTQTLRGMANHGPMHWRGDRTGGYVGQALNEDLAFKAFNVAFDGLLGREEGPLEASEMQAFTDFILQVTLPPNPIRDLSDVLNGTQQQGSNFFFGPISDGAANCDGCHVLNRALGFFGTNGGSTFEAETQEFKVPHLRNMYQKVGMFGLPDTGQFSVGPFTDQGIQVRGFGFLHDGSVDTILRFHSAMVFAMTNLQRQQVEQFMFAFDSNLAPIVGQQITLTSTNEGTVGARIDLLLESAQDIYINLVGPNDVRECDLIVKGIVRDDGTNTLEARGAVFNPVALTYSSDRASDPTFTDAQLRGLVNTPEEMVTYMCVPPGSGTRMGVDRDEDSFLDQDEIDAGSDPADPNSIPGGGPTPTSTATPTPTPGPACAPAPIGGCRTAGKSLLLIKGAAGKEKLVWKWLKGVNMVDPSAFGDPTNNTSYALCVYTQTNAAEINVPAGAAGWTAAGSGFKYTDSSLSQDGVQKVLLKSGEATKPKVLVKGKGAGLPLPAFSNGTLNAPVTVQLTNSIGECWEATYSEFTKNVDDQFKAKF